MVACFLTNGCCHSLRSGALAWGIECPVPRCWLPGFLLESDLDVRHSGGLSQQYDPGALESSVWLKPNGWRSRRLPMGPAWQVGRTGAYVGSVCFCGSRSVGRGPLLLSPHGKDFCRCGIVKSMERGAESKGQRRMNRFRFENLEIWKQAEGISQSNILKFVIKDESEDAWTLNNLTA